MQNICTVMAAQCSEQVLLKLVAIHILTTTMPSQSIIGCSEKGFQKRSLRWYVPCVPRYVPLCLRNRKGTTQGASRKTTVSERSKRSGKERDGRSLHRVHGPFSQARPFLLAELKRYIPWNFDMKRLIWNAFSERPRSQHQSQKCGLKHYNLYNESLQRRLAVAWVAAVLRKSGLFKNLHTPQMQIEKL